MWIFARRGFISIVKHRSEPGGLLVRARFPGDIEALFPFADVKCTPQHDYLFRATINRADVAAALTREIAGIDYGDFRESIGRGDPNRVAAYHAVWQDMKEAQDAADEESTTTTGAKDDATD